MKKFFSGLKTDPINTLADWQDSRWPWGIIAFAMIAMVLLAHYVFQDWMHMLPCEQCVYIRYGNLVMALGCIIAMINPKALWAKVVGYVISLYGLVYTIMCSWKLIGIHDAVHSDDPMAMFGMQGCSTEPHFPFGLPLEKWAPAWFQPTGDCGYDAPVVPDGAVLERSAALVHRALSVFRRLVPDPAVEVHGHGFLLPARLHRRGHLPCRHDLRLGDA